MCHLVEGTLVAFLLLEIEIIHWIQLRGYHRPEEVQVLLLCCCGKRSTTRPLWLLGFWTQTPAARDATPFSSISTDKG